MLREIEDTILKVLRECLADLPEDRILIEAKPSRLPAVTIVNRGFKIEKSGLSEVQEDRMIEEVERLPIDGDKERETGEEETGGEWDRNRDRGRNQRRSAQGQTSYKLRHKPLKEGRIRVECPPGIPLKEGIDYFVDFVEGSIRFPEAPASSKKTILVKYSYEGALAVKGLKLLARYAIDT
ncbi:hypothetical protein KEJ36_03485, partial [Candidatus Bathyarchaeota archaeon]|nr:hypothetical protein [Candidatus Bathyarchaeota archaeon]